MASLVSSGLLISLVRQGGIGSKPLPPLKVCLFAATAANIDEVAEDDDLLAHVKPQKTPIVFADRPPPEKEKEQQRNALLDSIRQRRPGAGAAAAALDEETAREAKKTHHVLEVKLDASVLDSMAAEDVQARRRQSSGGEAERFVVHVHAPQRILVSQYWTDEEQLAAEERIGRFVLKWYAEGAQEDQEEGGAAAEGRRGDGRRPQAIPRAGASHRHISMPRPRRGFPRPQAIPRAGASHPHIPTSHPASPSHISPHIVHSHPTCPFPHLTPHPTPLPRAARRPPRPVARRDDPRHLHRGERVQRGARQLHLPFPRRDLGDERADLQRARRRQPRVPPAHVEAGRRPLGVRAAAHRQAQGAPPQDVAPPLEERRRRQPRVAAGRAEAPPVADGGVRLEFGLLLGGGGTWSGFEKAVAAELAAALKAPPDSVVVRAVAERKIRRKGGGAIEEASARRRSVEAALAVAGPARRRPSRAARRRRPRRRRRAWCRPW